VIKFKGEEMEKGRLVMMAGRYMVQGKTVMHYAVKNVIKNQHNIQSFTIIENLLKLGFSPYEMGL